MWASPTCRAVRLPGRVCFQRQEEAMQINTQPSQRFPPSSSQLWSFPPSRSLSLSNCYVGRLDFLCGVVLRFSLQCCMFARLGQPTYVAHSRRRVKSLFLLPPLPVCSSFCYSAPPHHLLISKTLLRWLICVLTLRVRNYCFTGSCFWLLCRDPSIVQWLPCSEAPGFPN